MTQRDAQSLRDMTRPLWGSTVRKVRVNIQHRFEAFGNEVPPELYSPQDLDELCLDFDRPLPLPEKLRKTEMVGSLWIVVRHCGVRVQVHDEVLLHTDDPSSAILAVLPTLIGSRLVDVLIDHPGGDTRFVFDDDRTLVCFPARSRAGINWLINYEGGGGDEVRLG